MKKLILSFLVLAGTSVASASQKEFIDACLQEAGITSYQVTCEAQTDADADKLAKINLGAVFQADFSRASTNVSSYNGEEYYMNVSIPVKGLIFKKYLTLHCDQDQEGKITVNDFTVDIENRIDYTIRALVNCR